MSDPIWVAQRAATGLLFTVEAVGPTGLWVPVRPRPEPSIEEQRRQSWEAAREAVRRRSGGPGPSEWEQEEHRRKAREEAALEERARRDEEEYRKDLVREADGRAFRREHRSTKCQAARDRRLGEREATEEWADRLEDGFATLEAAYEDDPDPPDCDFWTQKRRLPRALVE